VTSHRTFRQMLARRAELTPADERRLRVHLEGCPECRETATAYAQQLRLLRSLPTLSTPPTLRTSVLKRIHTVPQHTAPWYRRRPALLPPLAAAMVLAVVGVAWVAGQRLTAQHGTQNAALVRSATPAPTSSGSGIRTQVPTSFAPVRARSGTRKRSIASHPTKHRSVPAPPVRATGPSGTSSHVSTQVVPTPLGGAVRFTATPVSFGSGASVAAGIPAVSPLPTPIRLAATRPSRRHVAPPRRTSSATSQAQPTAPPTSASVGIAVGPPSTAAPPAKPPSLAPIRGTPSPVAPVETPIVVVTPAVVNTPLPIVPATPTPAPVAVVFAAPSTPTPTPTSTTGP
jgi:hypothetical protein